MTLNLKNYKITSSDPVSIYEKANKIINKNKNEPIFLEIDTFRNVEHCGPNNDDHLNYRSKNKIIYWERNNVMSLFAKKNYTKYLSFKNQMLIKKDLSTLIDKAFLDAKKNKPINFNQLQKTYNEK